MSLWRIKIHTAVPNIAKYPQNLLPAQSHNLFHTYLRNLDENSPKTKNAKNETKSKNKNARRYRSDWGILMCFLWSCVTETGKPLAVWLFLPLKKNTSTSKIMRNRPPCCLTPSTFKSPYPMSLGAKQSAFQKIAK